MLTVGFAKISLPVNKPCERAFDFVYYKWDFVYLNKSVEYHFLFGDYHSNATKISRLTIPVFNEDQLLDYQPMQI